MVSAVIVATSAAFRCSTSIPPYAVETRATMARTGRAAGPDDVIGDGPRPFDVHIGDDGLGALPGEGPDAGFAETAGGTDDDRGTPVQTIHGQASHSASDVRQRRYHVREGRPA